MSGVLMGALLMVLGAGWLVEQLLAGVLGVPPLGGLARAHAPSLYWQFVYLAPGLLLALGAFLLRYRIRSFAGVCHERLNCAAFLLVSAGLALVVGKFSNLLLGNP
ncbi:MAG: hypothetical protein GAK43_01947 [Stenotrophomonas maltophilia]|nr:MAG: hypothetical protein GAK43_01947 [Stenotrophomonas maltophilia]